MHFLDKIVNRTGLSQREIARRLGLTVSTINTWKRKNTPIKNLPYNTLSEISRVTNIEIGELLEL